MSGRRFNVHDHGVADVAFSEDERLLATVGDVHDKQIYVWDMSNGAVVANKFINPDPTCCICWGGHEKGSPGRQPRRERLRQILSGGLRRTT